MIPFLRTVYSKTVDQKKKNTQENDLIFILKKTNTFMNKTRKIQVNNTRIITFLFLPVQFISHLVIFIIKT